MTRNKEETSQPTTVEVIYRLVLVCRNCGKPFESECSIRRYVNTAGELIGDNPCDAVHTIATNKWTAIQTHKCYDDVEQIGIGDLIFAEKKTVEEVE